MSTLKDDEALELFSIYAFRKNSPPSVPGNLIKEAVSTSGGLPLALIVIASRLYGKEEEVWEDVIARLREMPLEEVKKRLKISYDALQEE